ncbi:hypothetical protein LTR97_012579 [Elasticomyces elasticus]|uniref:Heterokaryon incompatibility domain-containing protein n=1 Tax=Elasticomyces elasticus TaxID=574655 RepID=A0AAN7VY36_9PEZI|nr:hypothetical protein LTR97_012579 [Elasticomyces elasticus]
MAQIYKDAWRVCVWLGDMECETTAQKIISWGLRPPTSLLNRWHGADESPRWVSAYATWCIHILCASIMDSLQATTPQWHTRVWIFQEAQMARRVLWCFGPFQDECVPAQFLRLMETPKSVSTINDPGMSYEFCSLDGFAAYWSLAHRLRQSYCPDIISAHTAFGERSHSLLEAATATATMDAADERDKIYSLLGVITAPEAQLIQPDYSKSCADTFIEATFASIKGSNDLEVFRFLAAGPRVAPEIPPPILELPTWAFNFSSEALGSDTFHSITDWRALPAVDRQSLPPLCPILDMGSRHLKLTGVVLDTIDQTRSIMHATQLQSTGAMNELSTWVDTLLSGLPSSNASGTFHNARGTTVQRLPYNDIHLLRRSLREECSSLIDTLSQRSTDRERESLGTLIDAIFTWWDLNFRSPKVRPADCSDSEIGVPCSFLRLWTGDDPMRLFRTTGKFLGLLDGRCEPGDVVTLFRGSRLPVVLRPCGQQWQVLGVAYVHGVAGDELRQLSGDGITSDAQVFTLC